MFASKRTLGATLLAALFWCLPVVVQAQETVSIEDETTSALSADESARAEAREIYDQGQVAFQQGDYEKAEALFKQAYDLVPHPAVKKSMAECMLRQGKVPAAISIMESLLDDPDYGNKEKVAARLAEAKAQVARLTIVTTPKGAQVTINGDVQPGNTPMRVYLNPGMVTVKVTDDDGAGQQRQVELVKGADMELTIDLNQVAKSAEEPQLIDPFDEFGTGGAKVPANEENVDAAVVAAPDYGGSETTVDNDPNRAFWAAAAVCGVGLVSGTVFGTMAIQDDKDFSKTGDDVTKNSGERSALIADISFGVALTAGVIAAIVVGRAHKREKTANARAWLQLLPAVSINSAGINADVRF